MRPQKFDMWISNFFRCPPKFRPCDMIMQDAAIQYNKIQYKLDVVVVASALDYM